MPTYVKPGERRRKPNRQREREPCPKSLPTTPYALSRTPEGRAAMEARLVAARQFTATVEDGRASFADMLCRLWAQCSDMMAKMEQDLTMPLAKRLDAMQKIAKVLPLLAKVEKTHVTAIAGVAVEDMSHAQLEAAVAEITKR